MLIPELLLDWLISIVFSEMFTRIAFRPLWKTVRMKLEDCCKADIRVNSPLSSPSFGCRFGRMKLGHYTRRVDSYIFLLFSYSNRFILVRLCEIWLVFFLCSYFYWEPCPSKKRERFDPSTKKSGREFQIVYICPHSAVDSAQWDLGIRCILCSWCKFHREHALIHVPLTVNMCWLWHQVILSPGGRTDLKCVDYDVR